MTSKPGQQTITIDILPNISRSKGNQAMKSGQVIADNKIKIFLQKSYRKCAREISSRPPFKKNLNELKASRLQLSFNIFR